MNNVESDGNSLRLAGDLDRTTFHLKSKTSWKGVVDFHFLFITFLAYYTHVAAICKYNILIPIHERLPVSDTRMTS